MPRSNKRGVKDSEGGRSDPGWKYCVQLEMDESMKGKGYVYVQCNFCAKRITGGVARLKHHLAKTGKNVKACPKVPAEVSNEMKCLLAVHEEKNRRAMEEMEELCRVGTYGMEEPRGSNDPQTLTGGSSSVKQVRGPMDLFVGVAAGLGGPALGSANILEKQHQTTLNASWKKEERTRVCRDIGRFFFENGLAFNCANSPSFQTMLHSVGAFGRGLKPPTAYELRSWILKEEVNNIDNVMKVAKASWAETGCSIMSDGWTDTKGRSLINFLVNNPTGTWFLKSIDASDKTKTAQLLFSLLDDVVEEVGEDNVIQVITDNASNYKAAGKLLMEKRKHLYWTPCAAHCIDLMLEDILKLPLHASVFKKAKRVINYIYAHGWVLSMIRAKIGGDLVRPAITRFATAFLTLQRLLTVRDSLESFFTSYEWKRSPYSSKPQGQSVCNTILRRKSFWPGVVFVISTTKPLVMVLRMVDSEKYPPMGFIYEAMDRAKEEIAHALGNEEQKYKPFWDIVDARWDRQLHTHLHAAAYFLNPQYHYEPSFSTHTEIKIGLYACMERLISDPLEREKVDLQIDAFRSARGLFGYSNAVNTRKKRSPAEWWRAFGDDTPELTKFAIKILSLTCSASGCERNWSSFNQVHTKRRNRLSQAKLNDLVYVMFNLKLKQREVKKKTMEDPLCLEDVDSGDEWVSELQTCEYGAYQELDSNTRLEEDVEEAEEEQDDSHRKKRKKGKDVVHIDEDEVHTGDDVSDEDDDEENLNYMDDSLDDPMSSSGSEDDSLASDVRVHGND